MDAMGVDVQVLSYTSAGLPAIPATEAVPLAREINDQLAAAIQAHPDRFAGFASLPTPDPEAAAIELERAVHTLGLVGTEIDAEVLGTDPWTARMLLADHYCSGRVFLAGDAAHLNPPWGGHGFNTGIGDAVNIGWKLAAVLGGWGGDGLLASYEAERRPVAERTIGEATANMSVLDQ